MEPSQINSENTLSN